MSLRLCFFGGMGATFCVTDHHRGMIAFKIWQIDIKIQKGKVNAEG
jgi:hypothetical protein